MVSPEGFSALSEYEEPSRQDLADIVDVVETPLLNQRFNHRILSRDEVYTCAYTMRDALNTMSTIALFPSAAGAHLAYRIASKPTMRTQLLAQLWESQGKKLPEVEPLLENVGKIHTTIGGLLQQDDWASPSQLQKLEEARTAYQALFPSHTFRIKTVRLLLEGSDYPDYPGLFTYAEVLEGKMKVDGTSHADLRKIIAREAGATPDELLVIAQEARNAEARYMEKRNILLEHNQKLVWSYACKIANARRYNAGNIFDAEDLWGAGQDGLIRAIERFNPDTGYQFSTYATWWVRQAVTRYLADTGGTIRLPVHVQEKLGKMGKWQRVFHQEKERFPTDAEIARHFDVSEEQIRAYTTLQRQRNMFSLDSPLGDDEDDTYHNVIGDRKNSSPFETAADNQLRERLEKVVDTLAIRERHVIRDRFGLNETGQECTLEEIAKKYGVTRERIRQIEAKALKKMRHPTRAKQLRSDYEQLTGLNGFK